MFTYFGVYSALSLIALGNHRSIRSIYFLFVGAFLIWFMGFRYETGCDYYGYLNRWVQFSIPASFTELFQGEEIGFAFLMGSVKALGLEYTWLNVAASIILVCCYIRFSSGHRFAPLIIALLFPIVIIQLGMSGIRQAIAGGFLMLAFNAFAKREKIWTAIWILVGMQFHVSVVVFLPMALLVGREVNTARLFFALIVLGPIASLLLMDRFDTYESRYIEGDVTSSGAIIRYMLLLLPVPYFMRYRNKLQICFPEVYPLLKFGVILILSLAPLVVLSSIALHRLNYYVLPLSILLCVYLGAIVSNKSSYSHIFVIFVYGSYNFFWFLSSSHAERCYVPYNNTWFF